jgi:hypothetical protein
MIWPRFHHLLYEIFNFSSSLFPELHFLLCLLSRHIYMDFSLVRYLWGKTSFKSFSLFLKSSHFHWWNDYSNILESKLGTLFSCRGFGLYSTLYSFFFSGNGAWTQGFHLKPLHQPYFCDGFFEIDFRELFSRAGFKLWSLLISASWVARIIGVSHWHPAPNNTL